MKCFDRYRRHLADHTDSGPLPLLNVGVASHVLVQRGVGHLDIGEVGLFAFGFRADAVPKMTPAKRVWDFGE
ncbi:MAG: hypothetical protein QOF88_3845 [Mycobacterium sp.]|nr:hypothetical protein [Mycobacterium sp.]